MKNQVRSVTGLLIGLLTDVSGAYNGVGGKFFAAVTLPIYPLLKSIV